MNDGWLLREGDVLASMRSPTGWHARIVRPRDLSVDIGAIVISGPAVGVAVHLARLDPSDHLVEIAPARAVHFVGAGHRAVVVRREVARELRAGDVLELRVAS